MHQWHQAFSTYVHCLRWQDPDVTGGHQYKPCPLDTQDMCQLPRCFLLGACSYKVPGAIFRCQVSSALSQGEKESYSVMTTESTWMQGTTYMAMTQNVKLFLLILRPRLSNLTLTPKVPTFEHIAFSL